MSKKNKNNRKNRSLEFDDEKNRRDNKRYKILKRKLREEGE